MSDAQPSQAKQWEAEWARRLPDNEPWIVRLDGCRFHNWTRGLVRPFDDDLREAMVDTAHAVMDESGAEHAYTQSDEVTIVLRAGGRSEPAFGGKLQKLVSILASRATAAFNASFLARNPRHLARAGAALFDARAFAVPSERAACEALADRSTDCWRNAVRSVGHFHYGHTRLVGRKNRDLRSDLEADGTPIEEWEERHTRGVALCRVRVERSFRTDELEKLPSGHMARNNPELVFERIETVRRNGPDYRDPQATRQVVFGWRDADPSPRTSTG